MEAPHESRVVAHGSLRSERAHRALLAVDKAGGIEEKVGTERLGKLEERHFCSLEDERRGVVFGTRGQSEEGSGDGAMIGMCFDGRGSEDEVRHGLQKPFREEPLHLFEPVSKAPIRKRARMQHPPSEEFEGPAGLLHAHRRDLPALAFFTRPRRAVRDEDDIEMGAAVEEVRERTAAAENLVVRMRCKDDDAVRDERRRLVRHELAFVREIGGRHPGSLPPTMSSVVDQAGAPRVSVLLRTKDRPGLLAEALGSLRAQTFTDFETVLVNDGGPLPAGLLEGAPGRGITVVSPPPPGGRTRALNAGLAAARGTYVAYLDDDDLYLPPHLETLVRFLDGSDEYRAAYTSVRQIVQTLSEDGKYRDGPEVHVYGRASDSSRLLYKNDVPLIGLVHRRALADDAGRFDETFELYEDWDFLIRLASVTRLHHIPRVTAVYRVRDDASNVTASVAWGSPEAHATRRKLFEKYVDRRSPATEMALVDGFDRDTAELRDERNVLRAHTESLAREIGARDERLLQLEAELAATREESATREQALAVENTRLVGMLGEVHRSLVWRLFTPWWKLKELLKK